MKHRVPYVVIGKPHFFKLTNQGRYYEVDKQLD